MIITKQDVLKAIKNNELVSGHYVRLSNICSSDSYGHRLKPTKKNCSVCVVGALIRSKKRFNSVYALKRACGMAVKTPVLDLHDSMALLIHDKDYLSALSCQFEMLSEIYDEKPNGAAMIKADLTKFVEDNFPATFEIDL